MASGFENWINRSEYIDPAGDTSKISDPAERILALRGIPAHEQEEMLSSEIPELFDPFMLKDMDKAMEVLLPVIERQGKVLIHGDYDTDGVTSTAILLRSFRRLGLRAIAYIPNRLTDGYGLAEAGVRYAAEERVDLLVTCDCGVQSFAEIEALERQGIPVIVTDHHSCLPELPTARAVINPNRPDDLYPCKELAGAGVALKLIQALSVRLGMPELWQDVIDLAAVGTVGDSMKLLGENRTLVRRGLEKIRQEPQAGLAALMSSVKIDSSHCLASDLAYKISPKINAAGRLGDSLTALELLLCDDVPEAVQIVERLLDQNKTRKEIESAAITEALNELRLHPEMLEHRGVVVSLKNGHAGVMGIIAQRLTERLSCPVVALMLDTESDPEQAFWRGSARAFGESSVLDLIRDAAEHCKQFGGHHAAAGVEVGLDQLDDFRRAFQEAADRIGEDQLSPGDRYYEFELQAEELKPQLAHDISRLEPFGEGNPEPFFLIRNAEILQHRVIGQDHKHLRLLLSVGGSVRVTAIYFGAAGRLDDSVKQADFIVRTGINRFRGSNTLQLMIEDHRISLDGGVAVEVRTGDKVETELLYHAYSQWNGAELAAILGTDSLSLLPEKALLGNLYRYLSHRLAEGPDRLSIGELTKALESMYNIEVNSFHIRRVLDIYQEAGLLAVRRLNHNERLLGLRKLEGKADLYETPTWKRLAPAAQH